MSRCANRPKKMSRCSATYATPRAHCCQSLQECRCFAEVRQPN
nr:unnamed protein product [Callosobruchus chinensis]